MGVHKGIPKPGQVAHTAATSNDEDRAKEQNDALATENRDAASSLPEIGRPSLTYNGQEPQQFKDNEELLAAIITQFGTGTEWTHHPMQQNGQLTFWLKQGDPSVIIRFNASSIDQVPGLRAMYDESI